MKSYNVKISKWAFFLFVISSCALIYNALYSTGGITTQSTVSFQLGFYIIYTFPFWILFQFIAGLNQGNTKALLSFGVITLSLILGSIINSSIKTEERNNKLTFTYFTSNSNPNQKNTEAERNKIVGNLTKDISSLYNDFNIELSAIEFNKVLNLGNIENDFMFSESKFIIQQAYRINKKYKKKIDDILLDSRFEVSYQIKHDNLITSNNFSERIDAISLKIKSIWLINEQIISETDSILDLLSNSYNSWHIENGKISFIHQKDLNTFNKHINNISAFNKQLVNIAEEIDQELLSLKINNEN